MSEASFEDTVKNLLKMPHKPHKPVKGEKDESALPDKLKKGNGRAGDGGEA